MLARHATSIIEEKFKSVTLPQIGYIRQAIFQALDSICTKQAILKQIIQNNPALDRACSRDDLITKSDCPCSSRQARQKSYKQYRRFKLPRPPDDRFRMTRRTKYFRRRSPGNYRKNDRCFICNKPGHFAKNCPRSRQSIKSLQDDIADHTGIYLSRDDDLESVFSLEDEPTGETLFSLDVYELTSEDEDTTKITGHNMYQLSDAKTKADNLPPDVDTPHVQLTIYSSKWDKPVQVIALMDTGAASSILNLTVLPDDQWISHFQNFSTPSKEILMTKVITKHPVVIEFFPGL